MNSHFGKNGISRYVCMVVLATMSVSVLVAHGCRSGRSITAMSVAGTYRIRYVYLGKYYASETLVIAADGTYSQTVRPRGKAQMRNSGTWRFDRQKYQTCIRLAGILDTAWAIRNKSEVVPEHNLYLPVHRVGGTTSIEVDSDAGFFYARARAKSESD